METFAPCCAVCCVLRGVLRCLLRSEACPELAEDLKELLRVERVPQRHALPRLGVRHHVDARADVRVGPDLRRTAASETRHVGAASEVRQGGRMARARASPQIAAATSAMRWPRGRCSTRRRPSSST
jgi:hypothetical protein